MHYNNAPGAEKYFYFLFKKIIFIKKYISTTGMGMERGYQNPSGMG